MTDPRENGFSYEVVRGKRKKTDIVIERDGRVLIKVPEAMPDERVREIVASKRPWIDRHLTEWRELNASKVAREFRSGESFLFLGRPYQLSIESQNEPIVIREERFCLSSDLLRATGSDGARAAFRTFYANEGERFLPERTGEYARKIGVKPRAVAVKDLGYKWGSCSPEGDVHFHWKCMLAPMTIVDYIVVHELCHLMHLDHSPAFWNEVDKILPDYRERKEWLRKHGAGLDV